MAFAKEFEELLIWQDARRLVNCVYDYFNESRDFRFRDQICSAAVSVMNNIAEGFERNTKRDFAHFLILAKASAGEVRSMLYLAEDRHYLTGETAESLRSEFRILASKIGSFHASLISAINKAS
jgi:four helix bundle protein